jgi:hypothetical protein
METKPPEAPVRTFSPDFVNKIKDGRVVTTVIGGDRLSFYLSAASATGFKVEKIADEGEEFPLLSMKTKNGIGEQEHDSDGTPKASMIMIKVAGKGSIGVSIEKPEGSIEDHNPFWAELNRLDQAKTPSLLKPTAKP